MDRSRTGAFLRPDDADPLTPVLPRPRVLVTAAGSRSGAASYAAAPVPSTIALPLARWPSIAGFVAALVALLPLAGWGAGWPALASVLGGWQVVAIPSAVALALAGVALALGHAPAATAARRRTSAWMGGGALAIGLVELLRGPTLFGQADGFDVVTRWPEAPSLLFRYGAALPEAAALMLVGLSLLLLAGRHVVALRAGYLAALGAVVIALLAGGPLIVDPSLATSELPRPGTHDTLIPPAAAMLILLLGSGLLLTNADERLWGVPVRAGAIAMTRLLLPGVLLLPPLLVWLVELGMRRGAFGAADGQTLLAVSLVVGLGLLVASAAVRAHVVADADRDREEQRLRRQAQREAESAALQAEHTARVATDRYRTHLRTILDVAPTAFLALDASGRVAYANAAAGALFGTPPERASGLSLGELWPGGGDELHALLLSSVAGAAVQHSMIHPHTRRRVEVQAYSSDEGIVLFLSERDR